ncbi:MAG: hypothetical protein JST90_18755 [Bacteroidetes bacterium]|nr:hypothetical protein [Bacteroidota bacterium]
MKAIIILLFLTSVLSCSGQIGKTREQIISEYGYYDDSIVNSDGKSLVYASDKTISGTGIGKRLQTLIFDKYGICGGMLISEPSSEINNWINWCDSHYVRKGENKWRNYEDNTMIEVLLTEYPDHSGKFTNVIIYLLNP